MSSSSDGDVDHMEAEETGEFKLVLRKKRKTKEQIENSSTTQRRHILQTQTLRGVSKSAASSTAHPLFEVFRVQPYYRELHESF